MPILGKKKINILTNILFLFFFFFSLARSCSMCKLLTLLPHGKRCCSYKNVFIYTYLCICIYIYNAYITNFLCQRQWKEYHNQETGVEVWEKLDGVVGLSCSFSCLNQGQCCSHFVSLPLLSSSPPLLSSFTIPPLHPLVLLILLYCECFLCSLQAVSRDFWSLCSENCMRAVGWGWAGLWRGCDDV